MVRERADEGWANGLAGERPEWRRGGGPCAGAEIGNRAGEHVGDSTGRVSAFQRLVSGRRAWVGLISAQRAR